MSYIDAFGYTTRRYTHDKKQPNRKKNKRIPTATTKKKYKSIDSSEKKLSRVWNYQCVCVLLLMCRRHTHARTQTHYDYKVYNIRLFTIKNSSPSLVVLFDWSSWFNKCATGDPVSQRSNNGPIRLGSRIWFHIHLWPVRRTHNTHTQLRAQRVCDEHTSDIQFASISFLFCSSHILYAKNNTYEWIRKVWLDMEVIRLG